MKLGPHRHLRSLVGVLVFILAGSATSHAASPRVVVPPQRVQSEPTAADKAKAAKAYKAASRWHAARRFKRALPHARTIWRAVPKRRSAEIYAAVLEELDRHCEAFEVLLAATDLPEASEKPSTTFIPALNRAAANCKPGNGWARITVSPADAVVTVSGVRILVPKTVGLSPGAHELVVKAPGFQSTTQKLKVIAGVGSHFHVSLTAEVAEPPPRITKPPATTESKTVDAGEPRVSTTQTAVEVDHTPAYALVGTGAVLAAAGAGLLVGAVMDRDAHEALVLANPSPSAATREEMDALAQRGQGLEIGAYVSAGVGLAALVTGIVLLSTSGGEAPDEGVQVRASWLPGGLGVHLGGSF